MGRDRSMEKEMTGINKSRPCDWARDIFSSESWTLTLYRKISNWLRGVGATRWGGRYFLKGSPLAYGDYLTRDGYRSAPRRSYVSKYVEFNCSISGVTPWRIIIFRCD